MPMGRRALADHERRRHQVNISLRDDELARLHRRADRARMAVTDYVRRRALSDRLRVVPPRRLGVEEFRQVARIGSNLNQIARRLNSGWSGTVDWPEWQELERIREQLAEAGLEQLQELLAELMPEKRD